VNAILAIIWTGVTVFVTAFIPLATGWATSVAQGNPAEPSVLRSAGVSAGAAALSAIVTAGTVALRRQSWFPVEPPSYGG
jgi:hypothetical protein